MYLCFAYIYVCAPHVAWLVSMETRWVCNFLSWLCTNLLLLRIKPGFLEEESMLLTTERHLITGIGYSFSQTGVWKPIGFPRFHLSNVILARTCVLVCQMCFMHWFWLYLDLICVYVCMLCVWVPVALSALKLEEQAVLWATWHHARNWTLFLWKSS